MIEENKFYWKLLDALKDGVYFVNKKRQITYWNEAAEKITGFKKAEVLGKHCGENILVHIDAKGNNLCQGACPLARSLENGQPCETNIYLHHKDGHRIPVYIQINPITDNKGEVIGAVEIFSDTSARGHFLERLATLKARGLLDPISGIPNQSFLEKKIATGIWELQQYGWPFGVITIRIDCTEGLKDNGKDCYSEAVRLFAQTLIHNITPFDWVGRWSEATNEEAKVCFLAIIRNTDETKLKEQANLFRSLIQKTDLSAIDKSAVISVSTGAAMAQINDSLDLLLTRAKAAG